MFNDPVSRAVRDARRAAAAQTELDTCFGADAVHVDGVLQARITSLVLDGTFQGRAAVFKQFTGPNAAETVTRARAELLYLEDNLSAPFHANRCLAAAPDAGWIVLDRVPGQTVGKALAAAPSAERDVIVALAGGWLGACIGLRCESRPLRCRRFRRRLAAYDRNGLADRDAALAETLLARLDHLANRADKQMTRHAIAHGDFAPVNLHYADGEIHAVDIQGSYWFPAARMAARFLVAKDMYQEPPASGLWCGLDALESRLFLDAAGFAEPESDLVLTFFIIEQFAERFIAENTKTRRRPAIYKRIAHLLGATAPAGRSGLKP